MNIRAPSLTLQALWQQQRLKLAVFPSGAVLVWIRECIAQIQIVDIDNVFNVKCIPLRRFMSCIISLLLNVRVDSFAIRPE